MFNAVGVHGSTIIWEDWVRAAVCRMANCDQLSWESSERSFRPEVRGCEPVEDQNQSAAHAYALPAAVGSTHRERVGTGSNVSNSRAVGWRWRDRPSQLQL